MQKITQAIKWYVVVVAAALLLATMGGCEQTSDEAADAEAQQSQEVGSRTSTPGKVMDRAEELRDEANERQKELSDLADPGGGDGDE